MNFIFRLTGFIIILIISMTFAGCKGETMKEKPTVYSNINDIPVTVWEKLSQKKIFFGHKSVGNNIISGIKKTMLNNQQIKLHIVETKDTADFGKAVFAHYSNIGKNRYPLSKVEGFVKLMNDGLGDKTDIAFLKFCYVDVKSDTDIQNIFKKYRESIDKLKLQYPDMTIVHFTVPLLRKEQTGIIKSVKNFIKGLMGKKKENSFSNSHNVVRNKYNTLLVNHYGGKEPVFDIARLESTCPTGKREVFSYDAKEYYALSSEYTDDGGHLNENGQKYIAEHLLIFLVNL